MLGRVRDWYISAISDERETSSPSISASTALPEHGRDDDVEVGEQARRPETSVRCTAACSSRRWLRSSAICAGCRSAAARRTIAASSIWRTSNTCVLPRRSARRRARPAPARG
jgi:hypothetical protein